METVSVIIPTFNRAEALKRSVSSALNQTYPVSEIFICDDGSTDNSKEVISEIKDNRIKWLDCGINGRPAVPRNQGIVKSKGEWLAFLDDDDEWLPEKIEIQLAYIYETKSKAACCNAFRIVPEKNDHSVYLSNQETRLTFGELIRNNLVICSSAIVHRSLIQYVNGFPEDKNLKGLEDYALWLRVASITDIFFINKPLLNYYDSPQTSIRAESGNVWEQRKIVFENYLSWAKLQDGLRDENKLNLVARERKIASKNMLHMIIRKMLNFKFS